MDQNLFYISYITTAILSITTIPSHCMVLRINDAGLEDLAEFTRQWMFDTLKEIKMDNYSHRFEKGLATGELILANLSINGFAPPLIKYQPHSNSMLYITTAGGGAEVRKILKQKKFLRKIEKSLNQ